MMRAEQWKKIAKNDERTDLFGVDFFCWIGLLYNRSNKQRRREWNKKKLVPEKKLVCDFCFAIFPSFCYYSLFVRNTQNAIIDKRTKNNKQTEEEQKKTIVDSQSVHFSAIVYQTSATVKWIASFIYFSNFSRLSDAFDFCTLDEKKTTWANSSITFFD